MVGDSPSAGRGRLSALASALWHDPAARCRAWIVVASVLVCAYAAAVLGYVLWTPEIGVRCAFTPTVNHFYDEFVVAGSPLKVGDKIVAVGGQDVKNWLQLLRQMQLLRGERAAVVPGLTAADLLRTNDANEEPFVLVDGQRVVRVEYERPGEGRRVVWCRFGPAPLVTLVPSVLWFSLKIGLFAVGAVVLWRRPGDLPVSRFFWLCIVSFGAYMGGYHWSRIVTQPLLLVVFMACGVLLPAVGLHFYLVFPRPKAFFERNARWLLGLVYVPPLAFLFLLLWCYLQLRLLEGGGINWFSGLDGSPAPSGPPTADVRWALDLMRVVILSYFGVALLWYLLSLACMLHSYRTAANLTERNQVKWILAGSGLAVLPIAFTLYLAFWEPGKFGGGWASWPMFAASGCITAAYTVSITRYRLMQIDQMLSSGATYFLISTVAGVLYYGVVFAGLLLVGSRVTDAPSLQQVLGVCGTALVLIVALDVFRGRITRALDRHLRREKHQLDRTLQRMSEAVGQLVDPPTLARGLLHSAADLLGAPAGAVYLRHGDPPLYALADSLGPTPTLTQLPPGCPLVEALRQQPALAAAPADVSPAHRQLHYLRCAVAQALTHEGQLLGMLVLAPRAEGPYTLDDAQVIAGFAQMTSLALVSAEGHRTIESLNRELKDKVEKIAEQQRRILALQSQLMKREAPGAAIEQVTADPLPPPPESPAATDGIVGSGRGFLRALAMVRRAAPGTSAVLLRGESGTGKGVLARALHEHSMRASRPFVAVHCAALSQNLLESELFGHVQGAFTGAVKDKKGRFELADGGTLFLDEIGDINLEVQTKLLRVLEEMTFERVGSSKEMQVDVRLVTATHRDLEAMIRAGRFREDLYFRLNVLQIQVPPLRERIEDIPELIAHFLRLYNHRHGKALTAIDDDALVALKSYHWPGNVRHLENAIERAVVVAEGPTVTVDDLAPEMLTAEPADRSPAVEVSLPELAAEILAQQRDRDRHEREQLVRALTAAKGNKAEAARALNVARSTLVSRLKKLGLG